VLVLRRPRLVVFPARLGLSALPSPPLASSVSSLLSKEEMNNGVWRIVEASMYNVV